MQISSENLEREDEHPFSSPADLAAAIAIGGRRPCLHSAR